MGINLNGLRFVLYAKSQGVNFQRTAMIGRQGLHLSFDKFFHVITSEFAYKIDSQSLKAIYNQKYADDLFRFLGAEEVHSFDASSYERASHVHDFNGALPEEYRNQYTTVIEGGTLEHIFNFPIAISNCMQMVDVEGHYIGISPTNNYMGHGFYQFSPELYFRVFCVENGFAVEEMILHEGRETNSWFRVADPDQVRRRVGLVNYIPTLLLILSKKVRDVPIFQSAPQQSDYQAAWNQNTSELPTKQNTGRVPVWLSRQLPESFRSFVRIAIGKNLNPALFQPLVGRLLDEPKARRQNLSNRSKKV